jgi:signal transduction histidine kinase
VSHEVALDGKRPVFASSSHLHQIVGNLIKNAFEALYGRVDGKVLVKTEDIGDHVLLTVSDNGPGIKPENLLKIFDPLFTTKTGENGGPIGNGLGLAYCKKMIESYGGEIRVESLPGAGTKFFLKVPVSFLADTASKEKP